MWAPKAVPRVESVVRTPDAGQVWLRPLVVFLVLSFGLTWGIAAAFMLFTEALVAVFGEMGSTNLLFILAVYAPAMAGLFVVWRLHGVRGVVGFVRRLTLWRMPAVWWGAVIVGVPAVYFLAAAIGGTMYEAFPFSPWYSVLPLLGLALVLGPVEEFGWRGVALPLMQRRLAPLWAGTVLGVIWIVWHLPAFFVGGTPQSEFAFAWFFFGGLGISIVMTAMFNAARGSLLVMALFHWQINNPIWPEAGGWAALLFVVAAALVVFLQRGAMLSRESSVTELLHPGAGG